MFKLASSCSLLSLVLVAGVGVVGCGLAYGTIDEASQLLSTDGAEAVSSNEQATASLTDVTFEAIPSADPAMAANALAGAPAEAVDASCRSRAKDPNDPNSVIITLTNCKGRFGRRSVSGTERVHFTAGDANMVHADFESIDLTIDGKPATHTASADITFDAGMRRIVWQGGFNTTNERGEAVVHTSDLTIDVDTATHCRTRNGSARTTMGDRVVDTTFQDLRVCRSADGAGACPTGSVTHTRQSIGRSVTMTFDGTNRADVSTADGRSFEVTLTCGG